MTCTWRKYGHNPPIGTRKVNTVPLHTLLGDKRESPNSRECAHSGDYACRWVPANKAPRLSPGMLGVIESFLS